MQILLTGGSASGKSTYAEKLALHFPPPHYYIATMRIFDDEGLEKVKQHRLMREGKGFHTIEKDVDLAEIVLPQTGTVLLECLCNLTANEMFDQDGGIRDVFEKILAAIKSLADKSSAIIIVTNDVGSDGGCYDQGTKEYIQVIGRLNSELAKRSDHVAELVCGIALPLKGDLNEMA